MRKLKTNGCDTDMLAQVHRHACTCAQTCLHRCAAICTQRCRAALIAPHMSAHMHAQTYAQTYAHRLMHIHTHRSLVTTVSSPRLTDWTPRRGSCLAGAPCHRWHSQAAPQSRPQAPSAVKRRPCKEEGELGGRGGGGGGGGPGGLSILTPVLVVGT